MWSDEPIYALSMHEVGAYESCEGEWLFDGFLSCMGKTYTKSR